MLKMEVRTTESQSVFVFLFIARNPCGSLKEIASTCPKNVDLSDGDLVYYWETKCQKIGAATDRAIKRIEWLRDRTGLDWNFDDEFTVNGNTESFRNIHGVGLKLERKKLW